MIEVKRYLGDYLQTCRYSKTSCYFLGKSYFKFGSEHTERKKKTDTVKNIQEIVYPFNWFEFQFQKIIFAESWELVVHVWERLKIKNT